VIFDIINATRIMFVSHYHHYITGSKLCQVALEKGGWAHSSVA
jgi:hypothetical protein